MLYKLPLSELRFEYLRSQGPGGQNVNKVSTKVRAIWDFENSLLITDEEKSLIHSKMASHVLGGKLVSESQKTRSQAQNKKDAIQKLDILVRKALLPRKKRVPTKIKKSVKEKRLKAKKTISEKKKLRKKIEI